MGRRKENIDPAKEPNSSRRHADLTRFFKTRAGHIAAAMPAHIAEPLCALDSDEARIAFLRHYFGAPSLKEAPTTPTGAVARSAGGIMTPLSRIKPLVTRALGRRQADDAASSDQRTDEPSSDDEEQTLSTSEFARRREITEQTVRNHVRNGRLIGWRLPSGNWTLPESQLGPDGYYRCMPDLLKSFVSHEIAWRWLNRENPHTARQTPLERLAAGADDEVLRAARLYAQGAGS